MINLQERSKTRSVKITPKGLGKVISYPFIAIGHPAVRATLAERESHSRNVSHTSGTVAEQRTLRLVCNMIDPLCLIFT